MSDFSSENTWEPADNLDCPDLMSDFHERLKKDKDEKKKRKQKESDEDGGSVKKKKKVAEVKKHPCFRFFP